MKIGGTLGKWSNESKKAVNDVHEAARDFVDGVYRDLDFAFGSLSTCLAALDQVRIRLHEREIEHHTTLLRNLLGTHFITRAMIEAVYNYVKPSIKGDPRPTIYYVRDYRYKSTAEAIDIDTFVFPENRTPCIFVHGKGEPATLDAAYSFYKKFEVHAKVFERNEYQNHDLYLVSYDTNLTDEIATKIKLAFLLLFGIVDDGDSMLFVLAVFWRELEDRANKTGEYLHRFLNRIADFHKSSKTPSDKMGFAVTHSLGCFTFATAAQMVMSENRNRQAFHQWLCFAAAVPSNGFKQSGDFELAPLIAGNADGARQGTSSWYSRMDLVLNIPYALATGHLALGVTGPLHAKFVTPMDVTKITLEDHSQAYFKKLESLLQHDVF
ncbi:hypothetical protein ACDZ28_00725 (plasmid) [Paenibacillus sp. RS8]|uniref:hypothetical protein n=1 Tax=Paenibacillus sp. RS8 TaxID=3242681 RepID=UPI0035BF8E4F